MLPDRNHVVLISTYDLGRQPFGLASPAAWLREAGFGVTCLDLAVNRLNEEAVSEAALIAVQSLHAFTFGAAHLAAMHFIACRAPPALAGTAQGVYAALSGGAAMGFTILLAGWLYEGFEGRAFFAMAALSAAGLVAILPLMRSEPVRG